MKNVFLALIIMLFSTSAFAANVWHTSTIKWIYPQADGGVIIAFDTDSSSCTNTSNPKFHLLKEGSNGVDAKGFTAMLAVVLAAGQQNKQLNIVFENSSSDCEINRLFVEY